MTKDRALSESRIDLLQAETVYFFELEIYILQQLDRDIK